MYVVKRPFKNFGKTYTAGSVIAEPADIKRFNGKLAEGKIIKVTELNYESVAKYFKSKYGVVLPSLTKGEKPEGEKPEGEKPEGEKPEGEKPEEVKKVQPVVVSAKAK